MLRQIYRGILCGGVRFHCGGRSHAINHEVHMPISRGRMMQTVSISQPFVLPALALFVVLQFLIHAFSSLIRHRARPSHRCCPMVAGFGCLGFSGAAPDEEVMLQFEVILIARRCVLRTAPLFYRSRWSLLRTFSAFSWLNLNCSYDALDVAILR